MTTTRLPSSKAPHPVDRGVGANIRRLRRERRLSQEALAAAIGLTFQQLQKYERGANRVSCSRLFDIAAALNVHPAALLPEPEGGQVPAGLIMKNPTIESFRGLHARLIDAFERLTRRQARVLVMAAEAMVPARKP